MPPSEMPGDSLDQVLAGLGSGESLRRFESSIFEAIAGGATKVVIFGCAFLGRLTLSGARDAGFEVVAFADNNQSIWGQLLDGIPVLPAAEAVSRHGRDAFFVVAVYNGTPPRKQLQALGCERIVPYPMFFWRFARYMPGEYRLDLPHRIVASAQEIRAGHALLSDSRSRTEFAAQIAWRCSLDYARLPPPEPVSDMYFPRDIMRLADNEVLVDCGAFDGDSIRAFLERTSRSFGRIHAFEPDARNRRALERYLSSLPNCESDRISVLPFGLSDHDGTVFFNASGTAGSRMTTDRSTGAIECRRLDGLLDGSPPTIIKMDIEGAEPEALRGATGTIRTARPMLAVCAYHKCDHLWTLPAMMKAALPEYQISLRRYAEECWETVYYAVPPERVFQDRAD
jgi:FkbM family methyltransferase